MIRAIIWLLAGSPGTIANRPSAQRVLGAVFEIEPQRRHLRAGPWHWKHLSDRIGRMSRLNSMVAGSGSSRSRRRPLRRRLRDGNKGGTEQPERPAPPCPETPHPPKESTHISVPSGSAVTLAFRETTAAAGAQVVRLLLPIVYRHVVDRLSKHIRTCGRNGQRLCVTG